MKITRSAKDRLVIHLGKQEKLLLFQLLSQYPRIPPAHHKLSLRPSGEESAENQKLLEEDLAEQRAANQRQLADLLSDPERVRQDRSGWRILLSTGDLEWLLQVLNDVRVGNWVTLGSPEDKLSVLNRKTAPMVWAMEMAGYFQMQLLAALERDT